MCICNWQTHFQNPAHRHRRGPGLLILNQYSTAAGLIQIYFILVTQQNKLIQCARPKFNGSKIKSPLSASKKNKTKKNKNKNKTKQKKTKNKQETKIGTDLTY